MERVNCNHRKSLACSCEWNLKTEISILYAKPTLCIIFLYRYILCETSMDYLPINPAYEEWFLLYNCQCQAAEPACMDVCACVSEQCNWGLCSSVYPVRPASVRFLGDSSHAFAHRPVNILVRVFHRLSSGYKGSGLFYVHDVST